MTLIHLIWDKHELLMDILLILCQLLMTMVIKIFFTIVMFKVIKWGMHVYCALNSSLSMFVTYQMWITKKKNRKMLQETVH